MRKLNIQEPQNASQMKSKVFFIVYFLTNVLQIRKNFFNLRNFHAFHRSNNKPVKSELKRRRFEEIKSIEQFWSQF